MNQQELDTILDLHCKWLYDEEGGKRANLCGADLRHANLCDANLCGADLCDANLCGADLRHANLCGADLRHANLCGADLYGANLHGANLCGADLYGANLHGANLCGADLHGAKGIPDLQAARLSTVPSEGSFIAWKQVRYFDEDDNLNHCIIKLEIPADAKRSNATSRKCRASKARVIEIQDLDGNRLDGDYQVFSTCDTTFRYLPGATVECEEPFDEDRWKVCASGIHFFMTREEAVDY